MAAAADKAARTLIRDFNEVENLQVSRKGTNDFVTAADLKAEKTLREEWQLDLSLKAEVEKSEAITDEEIVEKVFLGHATVGNDNPIPASVKFAIDPQPRHTYNPEKAREYLAAAGVESLSVDLHVSDGAFDGAVDTAQLIRESAAACGINVNVVREPADGYWSNVWGVKPWCASYWSGRPTVDWMFATAYQTGSSWNETRQAIPRFDELLLAARAETDEAKRAEMYAEMQQIQHAEGGQIVLVFNSLLGANSRKLAHGTIAGNWEVDGLRLAEKWWFA